MAEQPRREAPDKAAVTFDTVPEIRSIEDLFAVAVAMEHEAAERYAELAARMDRLGEKALADLFRRLEAEEGKHESGIAAWAGRAGVTPAKELSFAWHSPEALQDDQYAEAGGDYLSTPWKALNMAVRNEERAFSFYIQVAAKTHDAEVQQYAERMAREELGHVALLRLERRRAWRAEHQVKDTAPPPSAESVDNLRRYAAHMERDSAARCLAAAKAARQAGDTASAQLFQDLAEEAEAHVRALGNTEAIPALEVPETGTPHDHLKAEMTRASDLYEAYMRVIEKATDEEVVATAQEEARHPLGRMARLSDRLAALDADKT